jgi:hypothetical protein
MAWSVAVLVSWHHASGASEHSGPGDAGELLVHLGVRAGLSFVVGHGVTGQTSLTSEGPPSIETFKVATLGAGFDFATIGPVIVARPKGLSGPPVRGPTRSLAEAPAVTLDFIGGQAVTGVLGSLAHALGRELRLHPSIRSRVRGRLIASPAAATLDALCEATGLRWGMGRHSLVVAPAADFTEFLQEMLVDGRS